METTSVTLLVQTTIMAVDFDEDNGETYNRILAEIIEKLEKEGFSVSVENEEVLEE